MPDILIVEDGLHERARLEKIFLAAGFSVKSAESATDAESLLSLQRFRLCVLDIGLGDKSGSILFQTMRQQSPRPIVVIFTGNPSIYLKQKFLDEGAASFIVKASPAAENEAFLGTIKSLLGSPDRSRVQGIELGEFLKNYITDSSRELFLDSNHEIPECGSCGSKNFIVTFSDQPQLPPLVEGRVICEKCSDEFDPEVG